MSRFDRNLLFGILAMQMDLITREQLVAAASKWLTDKSRSIEQIVIHETGHKENGRRLWTWPSQATSTPSARYHHLAEARC